MSKNTNLLIAFLLCMLFCVSPVSGKVFKVPSEHPTIDLAIGAASDGDTILIAGKGHEDYQEIKGVKHPFDDRQIIREFAA